MHVLPALALALAAAYAASDAIDAVLSRAQANVIKIPDAWLSASLIAATAVFATGSVVAARRTAWSGDDRLVALANIGGIALGFLADGRVPVTYSANSSPSQPSHSDRNAAGARMTAVATLREAAKAEGGEARRRRSLGSGAAAAESASPPSLLRRSARLVEARERRRARGPFDVPDLHDAVLAWAGVATQAGFYACVSRSWAAAVARASGDDGKRARGGRGSSRGHPRPRRPPVTCIRETVRHPKRLDWVWRLHRCGNTCEALGRYGAPADVRRYAARAAAVPDGLFWLSSGVALSDRPALLTFLEVKTGRSLVYAELLTLALRAGAYASARWCSDRAGDGFDWRHCERALSAVVRGDRRAWWWHVTSVCQCCFDWYGALYSAVSVGGTERGEWVLEAYEGDADELADECLPKFAAGPSGDLEAFLDLDVGAWGAEAVEAAAEWMDDLPPDAARANALLLVDRRPGLAGALARFLQG
ncbi:hypothetical protein JKP88DRAFT_346310 [Tribonema minus]|uniref:Uncharacterized protein n=1 Tax=Tribonema minus TaxID=303371 RepID=A0A835ZIP4_9STRA|nr:hypothetical protein JKP88DRAFT_346310 [Tribonema minus]